MRCKQVTFLWKARWESCLITLHTSDEDNAAVARLLNLLYWRERGSLRKPNMVVNTSRCSSVIMLTAHMCLCYLFLFCTRWPAGIMNVFFYTVTSTQSHILQISSSASLVKGSEGKLHTHSQWKAPIWMDSGGVTKGRTSWQQRNRRQTHWHSAEIPSETSTKPQWHSAFLHCPSTSKQLSTHKRFGFSHAHSPTASRSQKHSQSAEFVLEASVSSLVFEELVITYQLRSLFARLSSKQLGRTIRGIQSWDANHAFSCCNILWFSSDWSDRRLETSAGWRVMCEEQVATGPL